MSLCRDPQALKQKIKQMEEEKVRLNKLIQRSHQKVEALGSKEELLEACSSLRRFQEEKLSLESQVAEQRQALRQAQAEHEAAIHKLSGFGGDSASSSPAVFLDRMAEELKHINVQVTNMWLL